MNNFLYILILIIIAIIVIAIYLVLRRLNVNKQKEKKSVETSTLKKYKLSDWHENNLLLEDNIAEDIDIIERLIDYFEIEKPYRRNITIGEVSRKIYTNTAYLSRILNQRISKNFSQFVNFYRIKETCLFYIDDPEKNIWELGHSSGFNNNASFISAFKLITGYTPVQWCKEIKNRIELKEKINFSDYIK
jgi:AraC-type DNA-binding domain-containing proteins